MTISWFCFFNHRDSNRRLSPPEHDALRKLLCGCAGLIEGSIYTISAIKHPYTPERLAPVLAVELEFATITACEFSLRNDAHLLRLAEPDFLPSLNGAEQLQQAMLGRHFQVPEPYPSGTDRNVFSYLVNYTGPAEDEQAWHDNYLESHVPIMQRFPGIRDVAVYTPAVVVTRFTFRTAAAMQRNKVIFDSSDSLSEALGSTVRAEMLTDMTKFPAYERGGGHVPMNTLIISGTVPRPD